MKRSRLFSGATVLAILLTLAVGSVAHGQSIVTTDRADYSAGDTVIVSGFDWEPGETVSLTFNEDPAQHPPAVLYATTGEDGRFTNAEFVTAEDDSGTRFTLDARGLTSNHTAQAMFTDAPLIVSAWCALPPGQNPNPLAPGATATYAVTIQVTKGTAFMADLTVVSGLPAGAFASFSPNPVSFSGSDAFGASMLTVTTSLGTLEGDFSARFRVAKVGTPGDYYDGYFVLSIRRSNCQLRSLIAPVGEAAGDQFGYAVAPAGDVNGDGFPDLIVGAHTNDGGGSDAGRAYVFFGGTAVDSIPDLVLTGESAGSYFGLSASGAGDVNHDGYGDLIVGAERNSAGGYQAGRAYLYLGGAVPDNVPDLVLTGETPLSRFGSTVAAAGDLNGDGYGDFVVAADRWPNYSAIGRVYVYFGGPVVDGTPDLVLTGTTADYFLGFPVDSAGDVNGDGYGDLIVGECYNAAAGYRAGRVYVYFGGPAPDDIPDMTLTGAAANDYFGESASPAGDVNGDGYADVVVGAWGNDAAGSEAGRAYVYYGGPSPDSNPDLVLTGVGAGDNFGIWVAPAGDVSQDGYADVMVGARYNSSGGSRAGQAYVFFGGLAPDAIPDLVITGERPIDALGWRVAAPGDMDRDGSIEVAVGAPWNGAAGSFAGRTYVFSVLPLVGSVHGRVLQSCMSPVVGGITVRAFRDGPGQTLAKSTVTDGTGAYALDTLAVGSYWIRVAPPPGFSAPVNDLPVTVTAGATTTLDFTLQDVAPPVPALAELPDVLGACAVTIAAAPTARDTCSGTVSGTTTDPLSYSSQGTFIVHWTYTDGAGNTAAQEQRVVVRDTIAPALTVPAAVTVGTGPGAALCARVVSDSALGAATAENGCPGDLSIVRSGVPAGNLFPVGTTTVTWTVVDAAGNQATGTQEVTVADDTPPVLACPANIVRLVDPGTCAAVVSYAPTVTDNCPGATLVCAPPSGTSFPLGTSIVNVTAQDAAGNRAAGSFTVRVENPVPVVTITGPASGAIYCVGAPVTFAGVFTDNPGDTHTARWACDATPFSGGVNESAGAVNGSFTFTTAGVYLVTLTVTDQCGGSGTASTVGGLEAMVVVYDPSAGFVTGQGWINSPPGAYALEPALVGKAIFGFVSRYKKGATAPTGETEFMFRAGNLSFHSASYEWLVIAGGKAQYRGTGEINRAGEYGFMLTAIDGAIRGGGDRLRMKIWHAGTEELVYDNQVGSPNGADPSTAVGAGTILIQTTGGAGAMPLGGREARQGDPAQPLPEPLVYALEPNRPNPFAGRTSIAFTLPERGLVTLAVYDVAGREVTRLLDEERPAGRHEVEWSGRGAGGLRAAAGVCFCRLEVVPARGGRGFTALRKLVVLK